MTMALEPPRPGALPATHLIGAERRRLSRKRRAAATRATRRRYQPRPRPTSSPTPSVPRVISHPISLVMVMLQPRDARGRWGAGGQTPATRAPPVSDRPTHGHRRGRGHGGRPRVSRRLQTTTPAKRVRLLVGHNIQAGEAACQVKKRICRRRDCRRGWRRREQVP